MKPLFESANPPVVRYADADPLFQRGQAKRGDLLLGRQAMRSDLSRKGLATRRDSQSKCDSSMGHASTNAGKRDGVGKSERLYKSERLSNSEGFGKSQRSAKSEKLGKSERSAVSEISAKSERLGKSEISAMSERSAKSEKPGKSERFDESKSSGDHPPLKKGGRGDLLFADQSPAKPRTTQALQKMGN